MKNESAWLRDIDGICVKENAMHAAWLGNEDCIDLLHKAISCKIYDSCSIALRSIKRELDLYNGVWVTDTYDSIHRYADDILYDWRSENSFSSNALYGIIERYSSRITKTGSKVKWSEIGREDFKFTMEYGLVPKRIFPPRRPVPYAYGEGHSKVPDPEMHPYIRNMTRGEQCKPDAVTKTKNYHVIPKRVHDKATLPDFGADITHIKEDGGAYDVLAVMDNVSAYKMAEKRESENAVVNCLAVSEESLKELLGDSRHNHAKYLIGETGSVPRCAAFSNAKMLWNLDEYGFEMIVPRMPRIEEKVIERVEYVIAGAFFAVEPRMYITGVAVMICRNRINWDLMLYLARKYGFDGRLMGIMKEVGKHGFDFNREIGILAETGTEPVKTESDTILDGLHTYGLT